MQRFDYLEKIPGLVVAKDVNGCYHGMSHELALLLKWKSQAECLGKNDYDIPSKPRECAARFREQDQLAMRSREKLVTLDVQEYDSGWKVLLVERKPLMDKNDAALGVYTVGTDVTDLAAFKSYLKLYKQDQKINGKSLSPVSYVLSTAHAPLPVTEKQADCLFLLIRGKSVKEMAKSLNVSPRTVESHLEAMKQKLKCESKAELIEKAITSGFLHYMPH